MAKIKTEHMYSDDIVQSQCKKNKKVKVIFITGVLLHSWITWKMQICKWWNYDCTKINYCHKHENSVLKRNEENAWKYN